MRSLLASKSEVIRFRVTERYYKMALEAGLWYNQGRNIVAPAVLDTPRSRIHLIGDVPMSTIPLYGLDHNYNSYQQFYVYTLSYPDGTIFYVGKGKKLEIGIDRIDQHESLVRNDGRHYNARINQIIQEIWASGGQVAKNKVAHFGDELEAYMYEWALMNMTTYAESLANIHRGGGFPKAFSSFFSDPVEPFCIGRVAKHGKIHHKITDPEAFCVKYGFNRACLKDMLDGKRSRYKGYVIIQKCDCNATQ